MQLEFCILSHEGSSGHATARCRAKMETWTWLVDCAGKEDSSSQSPASFFFLVHAPLHAFVLWMVRHE